MTPNDARIRVKQREERENADYDKSAKRHVPEINHFYVCAPLQHLDDPFRAFQS